MRVHVHRRTRDILRLLISVINGRRVFIVAARVMCVSVAAVAFARLSLPLGIRRTSAAAVKPPVLMIVDGVDAYRPTDVHCRPGARRTSCSLCEPTLFDFRENRDFVDAHAAAFDPASSAPPMHADPETRPTLFYTRTLRVTHSVTTRVLSFPTIERNTHRAVHMLLSSIVIPCTRIPPGR